MNFCKYCKKLNCLYTYIMKIVKYYYTDIVINYLIIKGVHLAKKGKLNSGFVQVLENLDGPGILFWHFPRLESLRKRPLVLESAGNLLNSTKCLNPQLSNLYMVSNSHYQPS